MSPTDAGRSTPGKPASNQGVSFRAVIESTHRLDELSCARVIALIAEAVQAAHKAGQAPGALTPSAILLQPDASIRFAPAEVSPRYTAPEKQGGAASDRRSDVFALGAMLWEALAHARLFDGPDDAAIARVVTEAAIRPPSEHNASVPPELDAICKRALARDPAERYQSPKVMAADIDAVLGDAGYPDSNEAIVRFIAMMSVPAQSISAAWTLPSPGSNDASPAAVLKPVRPGTSSPRPAPTEILGSRSASAPLRAPSAPAGGTPANAAGSGPNSWSQSPVTAIFGSNASAPAAAVPAAGTAASGSGGRAPLATTAFLGSNASAPTATSPGTGQGAPAGGTAPAASPAVAGTISAGSRPLTGAPATLVGSPSPALGIPSLVAAASPGAPGSAPAAALPSTPPSAGTPVATQPSFGPPEMPAPVAASVTPPGGARAQTTSEARHALPAPFRSRQSSPVATVDTVDMPRPPSQTGQPVIAPGAQLDMPPGITVPPSSPPAPLLSADAPPVSHAISAEALARHRNDRTTGGRDVLAGWGWTTGQAQALVEDDDDFAQVARASRKRLVLAIGGALGGVAILAVLAFVFSSSQSDAELPMASALHLPTSAPAAGSATVATAPPSPPSPVPAAVPASGPPAASDTAAGSATPAAPPPSDPVASAAAGTGQPAPTAGSAAAAAPVEAGSAQAPAAPAAAAAVAVTPPPESHPPAGPANTADAPRAAPAAPARPGKTASDPARATKLASDTTRSSGRSTADSTRPVSPGRSAPRSSEASRVAAATAADARKAESKKAATTSQKRPGARDQLARTPGKGQPVDPYSTGAAERGRVDPAAAYRTGLQQYARGDTTGALATLRTSLAANPSYAPTWRGLGLVYEKLGNKNQARAAFKRYLQLAPNAGDADQIRDRLDRLGS